MGPTRTFEEEDYETYKIEETDNYILNLASPQVKIWAALFFDSFILPLTT